MAEVSEEVQRMRKQFIELISAYSEDRWAAGWFGGIEEDIRKEGGIWNAIAEACQGWPKGYRGEDGWDPL